MKFALFLGCNIPARVRQYEASARAVLEHLGIEVVDIDDFKCCGNPIRSTDSATYIRMAARNLALAEKQGLEMMVLCKCCFGSLKHAAHLMRHDPETREAVNAFLAAEGLRYTGEMGVRHLLSVLYHEVGVDAIKEKVTRPLDGIKVAAHYGCHALRPSKVTEFDNPVEPVIFDALVAATGARNVDWPLKLECCGAPLLGVNDTLSLNLTGKKLADAQRAGAGYMCVACPYCQMQFDMAREERPSLHTIVYPRLLGLAMGIGEALPGMDTEISAISAA